MTKEMLNKYRDICAEIADKEAELNDKHYAADTIKVCTPPSYTAHSKRIDGFVPKGNTISLLADLSVLRAKQRSGEEYIESMKDYQTRKRFELRFIKGKTYVQIAMILSKGKMSKSAVQMRIERYLKNH